VCFCFIIASALYFWAAFLTRCIWQRVTRTSSLILSCPPRTISASCRLLSGMPPYASVACLWNLIQLCNCLTCDSFSVHLLVRTGSLSLARFTDLFPRHMNRAVPRPAGQPDAAHARGKRRLFCLPFNCYSPSVFLSLSIRICGLAMGVV
jgi:hypothetical protein